MRYRSSLESAFAIGFCTQRSSPLCKRKSVFLHKTAIALRNPLSEESDDWGLEEMDVTRFETATPQYLQLTNETASPIASRLQFNIGIPSDAILLLNLVAILWGSQHAVIKLCISNIDPSSFSLVRFSLAAILATPAWLASTAANSGPVKENNAAQAMIDYSNLKITLRWGAEMGFWMFLGFAFQSIGLAYTTALRSGFLLYLNVKLVPFFAFVFFGRKISIATWASALTALAGTALLAYDGNSLALNIGDVWSISAAAASAMFILRLESASAAVPNAAALNATCLWVVAIASSIWTARLGLLNVDNVVQTLSTHPLEILYLSAVTTALANWIQTKAQQSVSAERASVIYAMDPVWGALWANILLGETLSGFGILGAALITVAAATNAFLDLGSSESSEVR